MNRKVELFMSIALLFCAVFLAREGALLAKRVKFPPPNNEKNYSENETSYSSEKPSTMTPSCIVIDAGHGGADPGKVGVNNLLEKDINLSIPEGRIIGLLGRNGMGKTTLIKLINDLLTPTKGEVLVNGQPVGVKSKKVISYLPERTYLDKTMTVRQVIRYFEEFYEDFSAEKARRLLGDLELDEEVRISKMSKGMQEKLQLILVMSREAKLYILDEPLGGVDPATRDYILDTILNNFSEGSSVIICTHLIADIERILDDVIFIDHGEIVLTSSADELRQKENSSIDEVFRRMFRC